MDKVKLRKEFKKRKIYKKPFTQHRLEQLDRDRQAATAQDTQAAQDAQDAQDAKDARDAQDAQAVQHAQTAAERLATIQEAIQGAEARLTELVQAIRDAQTVRDNQPSAQLVVEQKSAIEADQTAQAPQAAQDDQDKNTVSPQVDQSLGAATDARYLHELERRELSYVGDESKNLRKRLARYGSRGFHMLKTQDLRVECRRRRLIATGHNEEMIRRLCRYEFAALGDGFDPVEWSKQKLPSYVSADEKDQANFSDNSENEEEYPRALKGKTDLSVTQRNRLRSITSNRINVVRHSKYIRNLQYHPEAVFTQCDVIGDGNCMLRAFAVAYWGEKYENLWTEVRRRILLCHQAIVDDRAHPRRRLYTELNVTSTENEDARTNASSSPTTRRVAENLIDQLEEPKAWGTMELVQLLADAFDVEILVHTADNGEDWRLLSRGDPNAIRQLHITQWLNHWSALFPVDKNVRFTLHLADPLNSDHRGPIPRGREMEVEPPFVYQLNGDIPPPISDLPNRPWVDELAVATDAAAARGEDVTPPVWARRTSR